MDQVGLSLKVYKNKYSFQGYQQLQLFQHTESLIQKCARCMKDLINLCIEFIFNYATC